MRYVALFIVALLLVAGTVGLLGQSIQVLGLTTPANRAFNLLTTACALTFGGDGGMQVTRTNLVLYSEALGSWGQSFTPSPSTGEPDPFGGTVAVRMTDSDATLERIYSNSVTVSQSTSYVGRVYVLKDSDTTRFPEVRFDFSGGTASNNQFNLNTSTGATTAFAGSPTISVAESPSGWWRVDVAANSGNNTALQMVLAPAGAIIFGAQNAAATGSATFSHVQINAGTTPTTYQATDAFGVSRETGLDAWAARWNLLLWSEALATTPWSAGNATVTGAAPDFVVTDATDAAMGVLQQTVSVPSDTQTYTVQAWIKKDSDASRFPMLSMSTAGGTAYYRILVNTSTGAYILGSTSGIAGSVVDGGTHWDVRVSGPNLSTASMLVSIVPARKAEWATPDLGDNAAQGAITVLKAQLSPGSTARNYQKTESGQRIFDVSLHGKSGWRGSAITAGTDDPANAVVGGYVVGASFDGGDFITLPNLGTGYGITAVVYLPADVTAATTGQYVYGAGYLPFTGETLCLGACSSIVTSEIVSIHSNPSDPATNSGRSAWCDAAGKLATGWHTIQAVWGGAAWQIWIDGVAKTMTVGNTPTAWTGMAGAVPRIGARDTSSADFLANGTIVGYFAYHATAPNQALEYRTIKTKMLGERGVTVAWLPERMRKEAIYYADAGRRPWLTPGGINRPQDIKEFRAWLQ